MASSVIFDHFRQFLVEIITFFNQITSDSWSRVNFASEKMYIETMLHQKVLVDDNYDAKTAKKREFIVRSTCFDTKMPENSTVSGKSSIFRVLGQFFRVGTQKSSFSIEHCDHTETLFTMDPLYSTDTSPFELVCYDLLRFCSFPDLLALLRGSYP